MRCFLELARVIILVLTIFGGNARAVPIVDQTSPLDPASPFAIAIGGNSQQILAQVVRAGVSGTLVGINLPLFGSSEELIVEIQGVSGGLPDGSILLSESFNGAAIPGPGAGGYRALTFSSPLFFSAGDLFSFVLSSQDSFGINPALPGNPYLGGSAFFDSRPNRPGIWVPLNIGGGADDLAFETVVERVPEASSCTLLLAGLAGLCIARRRRRRQR